MSATATYSSLLKRYDPEKALENDFAKKCWIWQNLGDKDLKYRGGTYEVPVVESGFNSVQFGSLAASNDIGEMTVALGTSSMKELWFSLLVREADLYRHGDPEQSYLKIIPERLTEFAEFGKEIVSVNFLRGGSLAKATADGDSSGNITVDMPSIFRLGMKVEVDDDNSSAATGYVTSINLNTKVIIIKDARSAGSAVDLSGYTTAQNAVVRVVGTGTENFLGLPEVIFPAAVTGGSASIYGLTKASYTTLQSLYDTGASWTAATVADNILDAFYGFEQVGRQKFSKIMVNPGVYKNIVKGLEVSKRAAIMDKKAGIGFNSISLLGAEGQAEIVSIREMPRDKVYFADMSGVKWVGAEPFKMNLYNGEKFYLNRATTGPEMISDMALRGNFIVDPAKVAGIHSIPDAVSA